MNRRELLRQARVKSIRNLALAGGMVVALFWVMAPRAGGQTAGGDAAPRVEKAFIANAGGDFGHYAFDSDRGADRLYGVFFADMKKWGRYEIVSNPARADWILQIDAVNSSRCEPGRVLFPGTPKEETQYRVVNDDWIELVVMDAKMEARKRFVAHLHKSNPLATAQATFDHAVAAVVEDFREHLGEPVRAPEVQHLQAPGPVPPQIGAAHTIFVNDISENDDSADLFSGGGARLYAEITDAFRRWGRYELVDDASRADLMVQASFQVDRRCDGRDDHRFRLFIGDPRTEALLWGITTHADAPILSRNNRKAFDAGVVELVNQFRNVTETTTWSAGASVPADPQAAASESPATAGLLTATISVAKNVVKSGSAVKVEVAVKNSLKEDLDFRYAEGDPLTCVIAVHDAQGNAAPVTEHGRKLQEAHAGWRGRPMAYSLLPGETQRRECAVSELYDMSRAGKYFIQVQQLDGHPATSNTAVLTVIP